MKGNSTKYQTTDEQIRLYETITPLLTAAYSELKELSKKKQDDTLNIGKVKMINRLLLKAKDILKKEPTNEYLEILDEEELPTNSDAVLIVSQFISALSTFKVAHRIIETFSKVWDNPGHWVQDK